MGMYDDVRCEVPLPDGYEGSFQTKDFECTLALLTITKEGRLITNGRDGWDFDAADAPRDLEFHGYFNFYDFNLRADPQWREYRAKFTDGQLVAIEVVPDETASGTEARRAETGTGSVHDGPVPKADANNLNNSND